MTQKFFTAMIDFDKNIKIESYSTLKEGVEIIRRMPPHRWHKNRLLSEEEAKKAAREAMEYLAAIDTGEEEEYCYSGPLPRFEVAGTQCDDFEEALRLARAAGRADIRRGGALVCRVEGGRIKWAPEILPAFERAAEAHLAHYSTPEDLRLHLRSSEDAPDIWWAFWSESARATFEETVRRLAREL
jgi:hypothetical protein